MKRTPTENPVTELVQGRLSRRAFVEQALASGLSVGAVSAVLSACGGDTPKQPETPSGPAPSTDAAPAGGEMEKELKIYNWSDYIAEDTVANFEKETGIKVTYDTYESNEELIAKLQAGASGYDLVCPSGYAVQVLLALDLLDKLDPNQLKNRGNLAPSFRKTAFDPSDEHIVPWQWGMTGIAWRKDKLPVPPDSWAIFHNAELAKKMTMMDDMRDVLGAWLKYRGASVNSKVEAELQQAKADAIEARKHIQSFISAPVKAQLVAGDVWVAQLWNGDTAQATAEQPEIAWTIPKEGAIIWSDAMCIPKKAKNKRAAHAFLDFIMRPEVAASIADYTGYGTPNAKALEKMENPVALPTDEQMAKLEFQLDLGEATELWDRIWTEVKAG